MSNLNVRTKKVNQSKDTLKSTLHNNKPQQPIANIDEQTLTRQEKLSLCRKIWERDKKTLKCSHCARSGAIFRCATESSKTEERYQCKGDGKVQCRRWGIENFYKNVVCPHLAMLEEMEDFPERFSER